MYSIGLPVMAGLEVAAAAVFAGCFAWAVFAGVGGFCATFSAGLAGAGVAAAGFCVAGAGFAGFWAGALSAI